MSKGFKAQQGKVFLVLIILAAGLSVAWYILTSAPRPERVKPEVQARLVEVEPLRKASDVPVWLAGGEVSAVERVSLAPRISGTVASVEAAAVPGAHLKQGQLLAQLDADDLRLVVKQREAALADVRASLQIEQGEASLAREEYSLAASRLPAEDRALVMREPQVAQAQAAVKSAEAALEQARLDLSRTRIVMPFEGQVVSRSVSRGSVVNTSSTLFELVDTSRFWVEVKLPSRFLRWLDLSAEATLKHPDWGTQTRRARVVQLIPEVNETDRQARVLLEIDDPLGLASDDVPVVLLGDFVSAELKGRAVTNAWNVRLDQLEDDNSIWVVNNNRMEKRQLNVAWRGREQAWVTGGFQPGDQLLVSRIDSITPGMPVRTLAASADESASGNLAETAQ